MNINKISIGMVGLGKLGKPVLEYYKENLGDLVDCYGYDVRSDIASDKFEIIKSIKDMCKKCKDIIFVAVPTPHDPEYDGTKPTSNLPCKDFDTSKVESVLKEISKFKRPTQSIVLISTVLPGTTREKLEGYIPDLIYNPYFIAMGSVKYDMEHPEMIVIGIKDNKIGCVNKLVEFYDILYRYSDVRVVTGTWEEAECIKVYYNTFITTKLTFVNMVQDFANRIGNVNAKFVTNTLSKSTDRLISDRYMNPGLGDGGPCHPRDNIALSFLSKKHNMNYDFFGMLMGIREKQSENIASLLVDTLKCNECDQIVINGKTYKEGVPLTDGSCAMLVGHYCEQLGYKPVYVDPLVDGCKVTDYDSKCVVLLNHRELYFTPMDGSIVIDIADNWKRTIYNEGV